MGEPGELRGKWWNARWGRLARRDIWLYHTDDGWLVVAREGDSDSPTKQWPPFASERTARLWVDRLIETGGAGWKDQTEMYLRDRDHRGRG